MASLEISPPSATAERGGVGAVAQRIQDYLRSSDVPPERIGMLTEHILARARQEAAGQSSQRFLQAAMEETQRVAAPLLRRHVESRADGGVVPPAAPLDMPEQPLHFWSAFRLYHQYCQSCSSWFGRLRQRLGGAKK